MTPAPLMPMADFVRDVQFVSGRHTRHLGHKDHDVDLPVLCWARGAVAPIHGHEGEYRRVRLAYDSVPASIEHRTRASSRSSVADR